MDKTLNDLVSDAVIKQHVQAYEDQIHSLATELNSMCDQFYRLGRKYDTLSDKYHALVGKVLDSDLIGWRELATAGFKIEAIKRLRREGNNGLDLAECKWVVEHYMEANKLTTK